MKFRDAKKLHNGDEVISKDRNNEVINVLEIQVVTDRSYGSNAVIITGIGKESGYSEWHHRTVK
jgi:hypothetical protein